MQNAYSYATVGVREDGICWASSTKEVYEKVGPSLGLTFEEYRAIWQGYRKGD